MKLLIIVIILMFWACPTYGCIGARNIGMAHSGVVTANDSTAAYWNPALLPFTQNNISYGSNFNRIQSYISYSYNDWGFCHVTYGTYKYFYLSHGKIINDNLSIGIGLGASYDNYENNMTPSIELSCLLQNKTRFKYGALLQDKNLRPSIAYTSDTVTISLNSYDFLNLNESQRFSLGIEYKYKLLSLQTGLEYSKYFYPAQIRKSYGIGINYKKIILNTCKSDDKYIFSGSINY